ncbi:uncharacterized protein TNCV_1518251 [Trichonephila clavipes]|nr:uncharacterized protein TNCV_1518251 [Trichonephila clavipes]
MARKYHLDYFIHGRVIGKRKKWRSLTSVAEELGINKSVVSRTWKAFQTIGTAIRKVGGGSSKKKPAVDALHIACRRREPDTSHGPG